MSKYYDQANQRLVYIKQSATPAFWDNLWQTGNPKVALNNPADNYYTRLTKRFLPPNPATRILEGGCGRGEVVASLCHQGYNAIGVDFAVATIKQIKQISPDLPVQVGDVTNLDFPANHFDGYWSLGVIEHSFQGYQSILQEMQRVLKPGGYLFITFPYLSPLRRAKAWARAYPAFQTSAEPNNFYQFALNHNKVRQDFAQLDFSLAYQRPLDGFKGLKEEVVGLRPLLQGLSKSSTYLGRKTGGAITTLAAPFAGHVMLQVFRKQ